MRSNFAQFIISARPLVVAVFIFAHLATAEERDERAPGTTWFEMPAWMKNPSEAPQIAEDIERLDALGYLDGYVAPTGEGNVIINNAGRTQPGHNLYTSGHAPVVVLADMDGRTLHQWEKDPREVWPDLDGGPAGNRAPPTNYFFFAHLFENGDILALYSSLGLVKLDRNSNILWTYRGGVDGRPGAPHHHFTFSDNAEILVLDHIERKATIGGEERVWREDYLATLNEDGKEISRFSLAEAFAGSDYAPLLSGIFAASSDSPKIELHTNFVQILDGALASDLPQFRKGNILISCRDINTVAVVDAATRKVVWAQSGLWLRQHSPTVLPSGNILLFDNQGDAPRITDSAPLRFQGASRIVEFDPRTQKVAWIYRGSAQAPFNCHKMGFCWRLPNGNTLVNDTVSGRAFEVTPESDIVWQWVNPNRAGDAQQYIASLPMMQRIPSSFPLAWLNASESRPTQHDTPRP